MSECLRPKRFWCEWSCVEKEAGLQKAIELVAWIDEKDAIEHCDMGSLMTATCRLQPSNSSPFTSAVFNARRAHLYSYRYKSQSSVQCAIAVTGPDGKIRNFDQVRPL